MNVRAGKAAAGLGPILLLLASVSGCGGAADDGAPGTWLIIGARIVDGTGAPAYDGALRVRGEFIEAVGDLEPQAGEPVVDAGGAVLAPGFIDTHSHADDDIFAQSEVLSVTSQGITTVVVGQDGGSRWPLADFLARLEERPGAVNVASYTGHGTLRGMVMKDDFRRLSTEEELEAMVALLEEDLAAGSLGLSTGLEYDPGIYSETSEVIALAQVAADHGGRYISHMRSEDRALEAAIEELLEIGRVTGMPVQISHFKLAMKGLWGRAGELLERLDEARAEGIEVTADVYPYEYWQSNLMVLLPERDPHDLEAVAFAVNELAPAEGIWFTNFPPRPEYVGRTLAEVADERGIDHVEAYSQVAAESVAWAREHGQNDSIIGTSMHTADIQELVAWPHANLCTDGGLIDLHPRARGSFPRVLGRYVREDGLLPLEAAVQRMTLNAAEHMGFEDRGVLRPGAAADLVLFDPDRVIDHATTDEPERLSTGVIGVWVNGQRVLEDGEPGAARPGRVLRRAER